MLVKIRYRNSRCYKTTHVQHENKMQKPELCNYPLIHSKILETPLDNLNTTQNSIRSSYKVAHIAQVTCFKNTLRICRFIYPNSFFRPTCS